jgi:hypothetical protein
MGREGRLKDLKPSDQAPVPALPFCDSGTSLPLLWLQFLQTAKEKKHLSYHTRFTGLKRVL